MLTVGLAPLFVVGMWISGVRINALPPKRWEIPLDAPDPPEGFLPQSRRFGQTSARFDEGHASPGQERDRNRQRTPDDPYGTNTPIAQDKNDPDRPSTDAGLGDSASEAQLRYEDHGRLRMQARREGMVDKNAKVIGEDKPDQASAEYQAWRTKKIKSQLAATIDTNATDHSTIMTNGEHAKKALAYDVAVGLCHISAEKLKDLRIAADWRLALGLSKNDHMVKLSQYFKRAKINGDLARDWVTQDEEAQMPSKIANLRENGRAQMVSGDKS